MHTDIYFSQSWRLGSPRPGCQHVESWRGPSFCVQTDVFLLCPHTVERERGNKLFGVSLSFFIVSHVQLSPFSHHHFHPTPQPPTLSPFPLWLCPWVLYTCSLMNLSLLSPIIPPLPGVTVSLFFISMSLVIFCFLVCFVD